MPSLDPDDWSDMRALGHRMIDDLFDRLAAIRERPVWRPIPPEARAAIRDEGLPVHGAGPQAAYRDFTRSVLPYELGNTHPRFMGWVHGGGNAVGMLAELLAAGLNANLGGRDHAPIEVERQVIRWSAEILGLPPDSAGLLVTGSSMANLVAVLTARHRAAGPGVREHGVGGHPLVGYASEAVHGCVPRAFDIAGLGTAALRRIGTDADGRLDPHALRAAIAADRAAGLQPFLVVGTAGGVDTGATDDLAGLAEIAAGAGLWFHVDGAFGAFARLSPSLRPLVRGIERADSVALDFHKWAQVPYDAGCFVVRDPGCQLGAFRQNLAYLTGVDRGVGGNTPWPADLGPDLSRGFRALKVWMTLKSFGTERLGEVVDECCAIARHLGALVEADERFELMVPVRLNIVCFRLRTSHPDPDWVNGELVKDLHEAGIAVPSTTMIGGRRAIRAAIVNHRTTRADVEALLDGLRHLSAAYHQFG